MDKDKLTFALDGLFRLKKPCANCPFRKSGAIDLRPGRLQGIIDGLLNDDMSVFHCHKTTHDYGCDGYMPDGSESYCVGALIYLHKARHPNVAMRLAYVLGIIKPDAFAESHDDIIDPPASAR